VDDVTWQIIVTGGVVLSVPFAVRATWRLWRLWRHDAERSLLLLAFWVVSAIVTALGAWVGFLLVRRASGYSPLEWSAPITYLLTMLTLQVPAILDSLVQRVAHRTDRPDNIGKGPG
jgi:ABC-type multidrug transport system fused ATPase/permease subunit